MFKRLPLFAAVLLLGIGTTTAISEREISKLISGVERAQKKVSSTVDRLARLTSEIEFLESEALSLHEQLQSKADMANEAYNRTERIQLIRALQRDQRALALATTHIEHQQAHLSDAEERVAQRVSELNTAHERLAAAMGIEYKPMVIEQLLPPEPVVETPDPLPDVAEMETPLIDIPDADDPIDDAPPAPKPISTPEPAAAVQAAPPAEAGPKPIVWQVLEPTAPKPPATTPEPPKAATPDVATPEVEAPEVEEAEITTPEIEAPEVEEPEITTPEVEAPEIEAPQVEAPEITTPEVEAPEVATPEVEVPEVEVPEIEAPEVEVPELKPRPIKAIGFLPVNTFNSMNNVFDNAPPASTTNDLNEPPIDDAMATEDLSAVDDAPEVAVIDGDKPAEQLDDMTETIVVDIKPDMPVISAVEPQSKKKKPPKKFVYTFNPEAGANSGTKAGNGNTTQLDNFEHIHTWAIDKSGSRGEVQADNNRLILTYNVNRPPPKNKCIVSRQMREALSNHDAIILDVEQESAAPARIAMAIVTRNNKSYYESTTVTLKPGMNKALTFDLTNDTFKCEASDWLHTASVREVDRILKIMFLVYVKGEGRTAFSDLRSRPAE